MPVQYYVHSTRLKFLMSCPKAIRLPHFPIFIPTISAPIWKSSQCFVFFFPPSHLSPPVTVWYFTMAENKQLDVGKICPPQCAGVIVADKHRSKPSSPSIFLPVLLIFVMRDTEESNRGKKKKKKKWMERQNIANSSISRQTDMQETSNFDTHRVIHKSKERKLKKKK